MPTLAVTAARVSYFSALTATGGLNSSFAFNTKNQITTASGVMYDSDGNLTNDGNGNTFSYDPEGKLTSSVVGGVSSTYKNDPLGHRAESVSTAGTFDYVYDPSGRLITETDTTCNSGAPYYPCTDFVYIGASSIPFSQFSDWVCCAAYATFNYYDFAGSLRETTSYAGLSAPYQNDPFGDSSSQPTWFGFAQLLTMGSGLQLSSTRGYHQVEARWLTPDPSGMAAVTPANPQTWNQYAYVLNNPVSAMDPLGLECVWDDGSFDSADDPDTGSASSCGAAGGTWFDPADFASRGLGDWSPNGNADLAAELGQQPDYTFQTQGTAQMDTFTSRLACAAQFGSNHSVAAAFGAQNNFVANLFAGNSVSGLVNLGLFVSGNKTPTAAQLAAIPLKGAAQGIPVPPGNPGLSGAAGQLRSLGVQSAVAGAYNAIAGVGAEPIELGITAAGTVATPVAQLGAETLSNVAFGAGVAKFAFDFSTVAYGYLFACE